MAAHKDNQGVELKRVGPVTVVQFTCNELLDPEVVEALGRRLLDLVGEGERPRLVLNLEGVIRLGSPMVGKLIALHRRAQAAGGRIVVCHLNPLVAAVFRLLELSQLFAICTTEQEALHKVQ
jgi:anti-anti-sigma factor